MSHRSHRPGWTVVEVAVVLAITGVLSGLALAAIVHVRESASVATCQNNLRQLALAVHAHHAARRVMPPYASGMDGDVFGSWFVHLLPYVDQAPLYAQIRAGSTSTTGDVEVLVAGIADEAILYTVFPNLLCPSDPSGAARGGRTNYLANWYVLTDGSGIYARPRRFADVTDGLGNTVLFAEAYGLCDGLPRLALISSYHHNFGVTQQNKASDDPSYLPNDYTMFQVKPVGCDKWRSQTPHAAMNVAMASGAVRVIDAGIAPATWKSLLKPGDGQP